MRRNTKQRAALNRRVAPLRKAFLEEFPFCWCCDKHSECVHEITRGVARAKAIALRETWMATCSECNCEKLTDAKAWPLARQASRKLRFDPRHFDLELLNTLRGRQPEAVTIEEVMAWLVPL